MVKKEEILARTSNGLDVFRHYLPVKWRVGRNFLNPLYADSKASCNVYYDRRSGTYRMKDFGNGDYSGDCFFLVAKLKGLDCRNAADFVEVLHTIDRELCLGLEDDSPEDTAVPDGGCRTCGSCRAQGRMGQGRTGAVKEYPSGQTGTARKSRTGTRKRRLRPLTVPNRSLPDDGKAVYGCGACYWGASGITEELLHRYGTVSLAEYRGETRRARRSASVPPRRNRCSATREMGREGLSPDVGSALRLWRTHGRQLLFRAGATALEGRPALPHGRREGRADAGGARLPCICFNSETSVIPAKTVRKLVYRFKHIVLLYDTDKTGLECSEKHRAQLSEYGVKRLVLPLPGTKAEKDVTDYFKAGHTRKS